MISYWHNPFVCPSVCPSLCDAVHCGSQGWCTGQTVVPACSYQPTRQVPICPFTHLCCSMYRLTTKRTRKASRRKREREFFETNNQACTASTGTGRVTFCYSL